MARCIAALLMQARNHTTLAKRWLTILPPSQTRFRQYQEKVAQESYLPTGEDRVAMLRVILDDIGPNCQRCKLAKLGRKQIVFGTGDPEAELMFIGEGPGADEDAQGLPFVGRAGQLLNNMIGAMGLKREDVYIANIVKCRPPGNRTPERDECDTCSPFLMRQIRVVRPRVIVALGATAAKNLLGMNESMASLRGRFYDFSPPRTLRPIPMRLSTANWRDVPSGVFAARSTAEKRSVEGPADGDEVSGTAAATTRDHAGR